MKEAVALVLKRYRVDNSNLPQMIDQFFLENSGEADEKDDELCYVDSLKQEAYEDKVNFDSDEIFHNVRDAFPSEILYWNLVGLSTDVSRETK